MENHREGSGGQPAHHHEGHGHPPATTHNAAHHHHSASEPAPGAPSETDPVCGMQVSRDSRFHAEHQGTVYHFCSERCEQRFQADPQRYLRPAPDAEQPPVPQGTIYTCPMHPFIIKDKNGRVLLIHGDSGDEFGVVGWLYARDPETGRPVHELAGLPVPKPLTTAYTISIGDPQSMAAAAAALASLKEASSAAAPMPPHR